MHPTREQHSSQAQSLGRAGDAGRSAAYNVSGI
jgi:hypothetical protein